ncbi:MAG: hypothetical protein Q7R30_03460 [Acidobacteriota bacterium]|nr:hypothetical protein [Acidobacteriota bacterium]
MKLVLIFLVVAVAGQVKPNFSGRWTLDNSNVSGANAAAPVVFVIAQDENTLTLKAGDQVVLMVTLDGSETTRKVAGPAGPQDLRLRAYWEGSHLVVATSTATGSTTQTVSQSADGNELTVETVARTPQSEQRERQLFKKS